MNKTTVLLTCANAPLAVESIRALKASTQLSVRVVGTDMQAKGGGTQEADSFYALCNGADEQYIDRLLKICLQEGVRVLIPTSDEEALAVAQAQERFIRAGIVPTVPRQELLPYFANKIKMYELLEQQGIPLPPHYRVGNAQQLKEAAASLGYPKKAFVIKPASARGGRGVWVLREGGSSFNELMQGMSLDAISLEAFLVSAQSTDVWPELIAMPHLEGDVFDVDLLSDRGGLKLCIPRRRIHPRTTPFRGCSLENHAEVADLARRTHAALNLDYLHDVDVMLDSEQQPHLLEVNPRQSGSVITTIRAGVNLLEMLVMRACDLEMPIPENIPYGKTILPSIRTCWANQESVCNVS